MTAMTMMRAITPTVTPATERKVIKEINPGLCLDLRYRPPIKYSKDMAIPSAKRRQRQQTSDCACWLGRLVFFRRLHMREENDIAYRGRVGQQHSQTIDPHPFSGGRRHGIFERLNVVLIQHGGILAFYGLVPDLLDKALFLILRII